MLEDLPVLGVCGWSGSGKTALIEQAVPKLLAKGLSLAVVKHDVHGIDVDRPGKDSDRLFQAGADVLLQAPHEEFFRRHPGDATDLQSVVTSLARRYDLVLVEGHKESPLQKVWVLGEGEDAPPSEISGVIASLPQGTSRLDAFLSILQSWLPTQWEKSPVFGCVLIGGKSTRMHRPKHLLRTDRKTWVERAVELLQGVCEVVTIVGDGEVPERLSRHVRLGDVPGAKGPLAGILGAMRWAPWSSWVVAACDLPELSVDALRWVLSTRAPGVWGTLPRLPGSEVVEPLLGHYDFRARELLERMAARGVFRLNDLADDPKVISPTPPPNLVRAWRNINTEAELEDLRSGAGPTDSNT